MTYAWNKLRLAVRCLTAAGLQRERLARAIGEHLVCIRIKDLPPACRCDFAALIDRLCLGRILEPDTSVRLMLSVIDDHEVEAMIATILDLYDAVTRDQPGWVTAKVH